jgi:hypothetical protein
VIADFNRDGRPDVFIADTGDDHAPWPGYQNTLILSARGGKLVDATANLPQVYDYTHSAAAADVNGDGAIDLYEGNIDGANHVPPRILLNDGTGHFTVASGLLPPAQTDLSQNTYTGSTFADVNGDGKPDLVLSANTSTPRSAVLLNDGTGHFTLSPNALPAKPFGPDAIGLGPASFDINGDGRPDLLIGYTKNNPFYIGRWIQVLINNGDGTFSDQTASILPQSDNSDAWPKFFEPRDLQRDGQLDFGLVTSGPGDDSPQLYLRDQNGNFQPGPAVGMNFVGWAFIDATGDGSNDIIGVTPNGDVWLVPELRGHPPPAARPPALSLLRLAPTSFRAARSGAIIARARVGTTVSYSLSELSTTTFTVDLALPGRRRGHRCVAAPRRTRHGRGCTRYVPIPGSFSHMDGTGGTHFGFTGRIARRALKAGNTWTQHPRTSRGRLGKRCGRDFASSASGSHARVLLLRRVRAVVPSPRTCAFEDRPAAGRTTALRREEPSGRAVIAPLQPRGSAALAWTPSSSRLGGRLR